MIASSESWTGWWIALLAMGCGYALTWLARIIAPRLGMLDCPDGKRKTHRAPVPLMGGVAVFVSLVLSCAFSLAVAVYDDPRVWTDMFMLVASAGLFCLVGLWDDRFPTKPTSKLLGQCAAALPFIIWGQSVDSIHALGIDLKLGTFGIPFTVFWLVACANVVNLVDGLDGLAGTIGLIASLTIAAISLMSGNVAVFLIAVALAGSLAGFLVHNWPPAKVYLGDAGSLMIGFLVGALSIQASLKTATGFTLIVPMVVISVPIFDTCVAILRRKLNGKKIGEADREHIHHRFQNRGLSARASLLAIASVCLAMSLAAITSAYLRTDLIAAIVCISLLGVLVGGKLFGYQETVLFLRQCQIVFRLLAETLAVLRFRVAWDRLQTIDSPPRRDYWQEIRRVMISLGGTQLHLTLLEEDTDRIVASQNWSSRATCSASGPAWQVRYCLRRDRKMRVVCLARGCLPENASGAAASQLFGLLGVLCQQWRREEGRREEGRGEEAGTERSLLDPGIRGPFVDLPAAESGPPGRSADRFRGRRAA